MYIYPFSAIVGQEEMKLALILNAIQPAIGGVLIRGEKGTAKLPAGLASSKANRYPSAIAACVLSICPSTPQRIVS